jgi:hypothetical protein
MSLRTQFRRAHVERIERRQLDFAHARWNPHGSHDITRIVTGGVARIGLDVTSALRGEEVVVSHRDPLVECGFESRPAPQIEPL